MFTGLSSSLHRLAALAVVGAFTMIVSPFEGVAKSPLKTLQGGRDTLAAETSSGVEEESSFIHHFKPRQRHLEAASGATVEPWISPLKGARYVSLLANEPCHGRLLVSSYTKHKGSSSDTKGFLVDLDSGARSTSFARPSGRMLCASDVAIFATLGGAPVVAYPDGGEPVALEVHLPTEKGGGLSHIDLPTPILAEGEHGAGHEATAYLFRAIMADRTFSFATWEVGQEALHFTTLPFDGVREARYRGEHIELSGFELEQGRHTNMFGDGSSRPYTKVMPRLYQVGEEIEAIREAPTQHNHIGFMAGGYAIMAGGYGVEHTIWHPDGSEEIIALQGCRTPSSLLDASQDPPAALFSCLALEGEGASSSGGTRYEVVYWTPEKVITEQIVLDVDEYLDGGRLSTSDEMRQKGGWAPVLSIGKSHMNMKTYASSKTHLLFDLEEGHFWRGEADHLLGLAPRRHGRVVLSTDREYREDEIDSKKRIPLYVLDMERGEEILLHTYDDCDGRLFATDVVDGMAAVRCVTNERPGHFRFVQQWSEVIDLDHMKRWRPTKGQHVSAVLPGKRFVMNGAKRGNELMYYQARSLSLGRLK